MKKIVISPGQRQALDSTIAMSAQVKVVDMSMKILSCHPDPIVRATLLSIKHAIDEWAATKTSAAEALVDRSGVDLIDLDLVGHNHYRITNIAGHVVLDHHDHHGVRIELDRVAGLWFAISPAPERMTSNDEHWDKWQWTLNGSAIEPRVQQSVKAGDVIGFGQAEITLT